MGQIFDKVNAREFTLYKQLAEDSNGMLKEVLLDDYDAKLTTFLDVMGVE